MILTMNDNIKFLQSFKGKTVEEVIAILQKKEQDINNKQSLAQQKKMEWYKSCIDKYYKIQHNNTTYTLVYIKERQKHKSIDQYIYTKMFLISFLLGGVILSSYQTSQELYQMQGLMCCG